MQTHIRSWLLVTLLLCSACSAELATEAPTGTPRAPSPTPTPPPSATPTVSPSPSPTTTPTRRPTATPRVVESPWIDLVTPITGETVTSPIRFEGRTNTVTDDRRIAVEAHDAAGQVLAETTVVLRGEPGQSGNFRGQINVDDYEGEIRLIVSQTDTGATTVSRLTVVP